MQEETQEKKKSNKTKVIILCVAVGFIAMCGICEVAIGTSEDTDITSMPAPQVAPAESTPRNTPKPTVTPASSIVKTGTHKVGVDIQAGLYVGKAGTDVFDSCYWARLSDLSGSMNSIIANDNAVGQFYVEVSSNDAGLETGCALTMVEEDSTVPSPISDGIVPIGTYRIPDDLSPGLYRGEAGMDFLNSCYWARLSDLSGDANSIIANDNSVGQFYVEVDATDAALKTDCDLTIAE